MLSHYFNAALNLFGAGADFAVAYWLFQRSRREWDDDEEEYEDVEE